MTAKIYNSPQFMDVFLAIAKERIRQKKLLAAGKIAFAMSSPNVESDLKLRVLVEEVGEVAKAIDLMDAAGFNCKARRDDLKTELTQVAAVAVAWLESLEGGRP